MDFMASGRLDLVNIGRTLEGSFSELSWGLGYQWYARDFGGTDTRTILLGGLSWGVYLGHDPNGWGEAKIFYNHRHDGYAGGLKNNGVGSGIPGSFGAALTKSVYKNWGMWTDVEYGSGLVFRLGAEYRYGGRR